MSSLAAVQTRPLIPQIETPPFSRCLSGPGAFYSKEGYALETQRDLSASSVPTIYRLETESKIRRIAKLVFSVIVFPIGIYYVLHSLIGKIVVPSSNIDKEQVQAARSQINCSSTNPWKFKRIAIDVDGIQIDVMICGRPETFGNGRWMIASLGNGEVYEGSRGPLNVMAHLGSNGIFFNYPSVGASGGSLSKDNMVKAYKAVLSFLEDNQKGIGASEIVGYGFSIGGGIQGEALKTHNLKQGIRYVFVKDRTFSNLSSVVSSMMHPFVGFLVKIFGWNIDSVASSRRLQVPEVILQTSNSIDPVYPGLVSGGIRRTDGIITKEASLAFALLNDASVPKHNKTFVGLTEHHNHLLEQPEAVARIIQLKLRRD